MAILMRKRCDVGTLTNVRISSFLLTALESPVGRVEPTEASVSTYKKRDLGTKRNKSTAKKLKEADKKRQ